MLRNVAVAVLATVLALLAGEVGVRLADLRIRSLHRGLIKFGEMQVLDPEEHFLSGPPATRTLLWGHEARFNSLGMRDEEPRLPKPDGLRRVLVLGDSVTFGQGVAQEDTYPYRLRAALAPAGVDVVTASAPGWNTLEEERFLRRHLERLAPDLVVLLYVSNDHEPVNPFHRARGPALGPGERLYRFLLLHSRLFEWIAYVYRSRVAGPDTAGLALAARWHRLVDAQGEPFTSTDRGWLESRAAILRMQQALAARGARLVVFLYDLGTLGDTMPVLPRLRELEAEAGVPVFATRPFFAAHEPAALMNAPGIDPHPNARGHMLLAEGIVRVLDDEALTPR